MADLIAWLDAQEQKPFSIVAPTDAIVEAFDPLLRRWGAEDFALRERILEIYDRGRQGMMMMMKLYSAKTIEEYSKALYIKLKLIN